MNENHTRPKRCTEWRPRDAAGQFGRHAGAAIGELIVGRQRRRLRVMNANTSVTTVRVNKIAANLVGSLLTVLLCAAFIAFARLLPYYSPSGALWHAPAVLISIVMVIVVHEALHGVGMAWFGKVSWRDIRFGFMGRALMPYCHCTVPMSVRACRRMALFPLWTTGGVTLAFLLAFPADWVGFITGFTVAACVGDVWIVARLRRFADDWLVQDSPSEIGCDVFSPVTQTVT